MQIPVLIEPVPTNGFRARSGEPLPLTAEGATREEALGKLRQMVECKLQNGSEIVGLQLSAAGHPALCGASLFGDDATFEEFKAILEENRRKADEAEGIR